MARDDVYNSVKTLRYMRCFEVAYESEQVLYLEVSKFCI